MLDHNSFIKEYYPNATDEQKTDIVRFLSRIDEIAEGDDLQERLSDKTVLCNVFYFQKLSSITRTHYQKIKKYLLNLFDWLNITGSIPSHSEVIEAGKYVCFFRDLDSALAFIDKIGDNKLTNYNPNVDLVTIKSIYVLGWYGLSLDEIIELKKTAVVEQNEGGCVILNERSVFIEKTYFDILFSLKYLDSYKSLPKGKTRYLKGRDEFMFRATIENCEHFGKDSIVQMLQRFNTHIPFYEKQSIAFRYIYTNAMFVKIYEDKTDKSIDEKIINVMNCSSKQMYSYKAQYFIWAKMIDEKII